MEDKEIVDLYFDRNEEAINQSNIKYGGYCGKIAYNILYDYEDSKECVNDTWLNAWNSIPPTKPNKLGIYLGKICRNLALNMYEKYTALKRGGTQSELALDELEEVVGHKSDVEEYVDESLLKDSINNFLRGIDKNNRIVFVSRYFYMSSINEISKEYGLSESNVKMMLKRTRDKLKEYLIKEGYSL